MTMAEKCDLKPVCPVYKMYSVLSKTEAGKHMLNAKKEMLLAFKAMIEKEVERIDRAKEGQKAQKVKIK
jgi:hypothetical protein